MLICAINDHRSPSIALDRPHRLIQPNTRNWIWRKCDAHWRKKERKKRTKHTYKLVSSGIQANSLSLFLSVSLWIPLWTVFVAYVHQLNMYERKFTASLGLNNVYMCFPFNLAFFFCFCTFSLQSLSIRGARTPHCLCTIFCGLWIRATFTRKIERNAEIYFIEGTVFN